MTCSNRIRVVLAAALISVLAACGSGDGSGTRPSISITLVPDASIASPEQPAETDAAAPPAATAAPEAPPVETQPAPQPTEAAPEQPAAQETAAPSNTVAPTDDGDSTLWWPWVLGAIVLIAAIIAISRRRRPSASWQTQATTLLDDIDQLTSHLVVITPDGLRAVAQADAMRLAAMRATLRQAIATASNSADQAMLNELTASLAALHAAVDAAALSAQPDAASVSQLATQLHTSAASVRAGLAVHH